MCYWRSDVCPSAPPTSPAPTPPARQTSTQPRTGPEHRAAASGRWAAARTCRSHRPPGDRCRGTGGSVGAVTTLAERLGYGPEDRLLIINCDDLGSCHAANLGTYEALRDGLATSATLMVPCPCARDAASRPRGDDVGVPQIGRPSLRDRVVESV